MLLQKYPMIYVDAFLCAKDSVYYSGVKNHTRCSASHELSAVFCIEGMGQTVEYNIRSRQSSYNKKLILAAVKSFEILSMNPVIETLEYHIISLDSSFGFYTSKVEACNPLDENAVVMTAEMVHKII